MVQARLQAAGHQLSSNAAYLFQLWLGQPQATLISGFVTWVARVSALKVVSHTTLCA